MLELNAGTFFGSEVRNRNIGGIWTSLARYDETLRLRPTNLSNDWHVHENPHFSFILEGGNVERRKNSRHECLPGQVRFYRAGEPHQNVNVRYPSKNFNVEIDADFLAKYSLKEPKINSDFIIGSGIKFALLRIYKETVNQDETSELAIHSLILEAVSEKENGAKTQRRLPRWADKVIQILRDRWDENLSLQELSEA